MRRTGRRGRRVKLVVFIFVLFNLAIPIIILILDKPLEDSLRSGW